MPVLSGLDWKPWIFAAKTAASGLVALLVAFTFNLDQPQWTLLTVFIVAQPHRDGAVLGKSFYRIVGTFIGAAVALVLVALTAQQRVLFLGGLALWIGVCTLGSQYARSWAAYSFVLSGYTAAIVGIPGALDAGTAFYIAMARVTEVCIGIMVTATIAHVILPDSVATSLYKVLAEGRRRLVACAVSVLTAGKCPDLVAELLKNASAADDLLRSAVFDEPRIREARGRIRSVVGASVDVLASSQPLERQLEAKQGDGCGTFAGFGQIRNEAVDAVRAWEAGRLSAAALGQCLADAGADLQPRRASPALAADWLHGPASGPTRETRLGEFFESLTNYALAYDSVPATGSGPSVRIGLTDPGDFMSALLTGLRAALAVGLTGWFWIMADWPHGSTTTILAAVATARIATMGHAVALSIAAALIFSLSAFPAFVIVETLLPLTSGFPAFALVVGPMLFICAYLMAFERTMIIGYMSALLFASVGAFQNRMVYDPIGLVNTSIAAVLAVCVALVLWSVIAPETPRARRRRFVHAARRAMAPILAASERASLAEFEGVMGSALARFAGVLRPEQPEDRAWLAAGVALLGAGREMILLRQDWRRPLDHVPFPNGPYVFQRPAWRDLEAALEKCLSAMSRGTPSIEDLKLAMRDVADLQMQLSHGDWFPLRSAKEVRVVA